MKATTFIIYQYFNSLLTLNRSLKTYFAASPAYHVDTNRSPIASKWYHRTPVELSRNFEVNSLTSSLPIFLDIFTSPNNCKNNDPLEFGESNMSTYYTHHTNLIILPKLSSNLPHYVKIATP